MKKRIESPYTADNNKGCTRCGILFEPSFKHFSKDKSKIDGLTNWCKKCRRRIYRKYYRLKQTYAQRHKKAYDKVGMPLTE